ncbi:Arabinan endo-1,5-alpha-L-arabinosidase [Bacillus licheniformis]|nr:Arabinan endo-1,5-alpha-L-arabinosidase [Bacillus licheniformis]
MLKTSKFERRTTVAKTIISGFILFFLLIFSAAEPTSAAFWDTKGDNIIHDPSMIKEGNTWYTFGTGIGNGIRVIKSTDGKTWSAAPSIFATPLSWWKKYVPNHEENQWAPDISYYNGRYWLYYAVSAFGSNTSAIGLASTDRISSGNWRDDGLVIRTTTSNNYNAIDPELVIDKEGNPWLSFGSFWSGIKLTKLDKKR